MDKENSGYAFWEEYFTVGLVLAILLAMLLEKDGYPYQLVASIVFGVFCGITSNFRIFVSLYRKHWLVITAFATYVGYYCIHNHSIEFGIIGLTAFSIFCCGYIMTIQLGDYYAGAYAKLQMILLPIMVLGIVNIKWDGLTGCFMTYQAEFVAAVIFGVLSLLYAENTKSKIMGGVIALCAMVILINKDAICFDGLNNSKNYIVTCFSGSINEVIFGRGAAETFNAEIINDDNGFWLFFYEYGIMLLLACIVALVWAIVIMIRKKDCLLKKQATLVIAILIVNGVVSSQYWSGISFMILTAIGVLAGRNDFVSVGHKVGPTEEEK